MKPKPSTTQNPESSSLSPEKCLWMTNGVPCNRLCQSSEELHSHIKAVHVVRSTRTCLWKNCKNNTTVYNATRNLMDHLSDHTGVGNHKCPECGQILFARSGLQKHRKTIHGVKAQKAPKMGTRCLCSKDKEECTFVGEDAADLTKHIMTNHMEGTTKIICYWKDCSLNLKGISNSTDFLEHVRRHTDDRPFKCVHCPEAFPMERRLTKHLQDKHLEELQKNQQPHSFCHWKEKDEEECKFAGATPLELTTHVLKEHIRKSACFFCHWDGCGRQTKPFPDEYGYIKHFRGNHNEKDMPYQCTVCPRNPSLKRDLDHHVRTEHQDWGENPIFKCYWMANFVTCGHTFRNLTELSEHISSEHADDLENLICNWDGCWKEFQTALFTGVKLQGYPEFVSHLTSHTVDNSVTCNICQKKFKREKLVQHQRKAHQEELRGSDAASLTVCLWRDDDDETCAQACWNPAELTEHIQKTHKEGFENFVCRWEGCEQEFGRISKFVKHLCSHTNDNSILHRTTDLSKNHKRAESNKDRGKRKRGKKAVGDNLEDDQGQAKQRQKKVKSVQALPATAPTCPNYPFTPQVGAYIDGYFPISTDSQFLGNEEWHQHAPGNVVDVEENEPVYMDISNNPRSSNVADFPPPDDFGFGYERL
ncbi:unnamed protein product [Caenorhabditis brenneri]